MSKLPHGWCEVQTKDLVDADAPIVYGILQPGPVLDIGIPYVRPTEIYNDVVDVASIRRTSRAIADKYERSALKPDDVILSIVGTIGKVALVPDSLENGNITQSSARLRGDGRLIAARYLANALRAPQLRDQFDQDRLGTAVPRLNLAHVREFSVKVAPLPEQHRIVEAIESYLTRLDDAVASLERVQKNLKRYRASVLQAAVEGRLVPTEAELARKEGRGYEPASVLLERILKERRRRWEENGGKGKYKEPLAPDTSELPELPEGWCWATVDALSDAQRSVTYGVVKLGEVWPGGIPTLRSSNVRHLRLDLGYVKPISPTIASGYRRTNLLGGEVLVTVRGSLGGVAVVPTSCIGFNVSREVAMIALVDKNVGPALSCFIAAPLLQTWMLRRTKGITYRGVNIETLKQLPVPLPPLAEQQRVADAVRQHLEVEEGVQAACEVNLGRCQRLRQSILKWAFEGKLVDQDPNDEPASVLLERIKAERAAMTPNKKSPRRKK